MVVAIATFRPEAASMAAMNVAVVVFPFVPVTPITRIPRAGNAYRAPAASPFARWYASRAGEVFPMMRRRRAFTPGILSRGTGRGLGSGGDPW